jgi:hypothetical protein
VGAIALLLIVSLINFFIVCYNRYGIVAVEISLFMVYVTAGFFWTNAKLEEIRQELTKEEIHG